VKVGKPWQASDASAAIIEESIPPLNIIPTLSSAKRVLCTAF
jgi:hypothetical protein